MGKCGGCIFKFLKCIAVTINIIVFLIGITLLAGAIYVKTNVNLKEKLGNEYRDKVPDIEQFVPGDTKNANIAKLQKEADEFVDKGMDKVVSTVHHVIIAIIVIGLVTSSIALMGIIAFTCCNKKKCCILMFLIVLFLLLVPFIVILAFTAKESYLRGFLFEKLDDVALKTKFVNRFFMAVIQQQFECCAVRTAADYFCHDIYDWACNAGCLTTGLIWNRMKNPLAPRACKKDTWSVDMCKALRFSSDDCTTKLNVPKPIAASKATACKNYKGTLDRNLDESDSESYISSLKTKFQQYDPAQDDPLTSRTFRVFGSSLNDNGVLRRPGCGYKIWGMVDMKSYLNYAMIFSLVIIILLVFQIVVAFLSLCCNKKDKVKKLKKRSSSSSSKSSSSSS